MEIQDPGGTGKIILRCFVVAVMFITAVEHGYRAWTERSIPQAVYGMLVLACIAVFTRILFDERNGLHKN